VVIQCLKINFKSATFATKLCTRMDETRLTREHRTQRVEAWKLNNLGLQMKIIFSFEYPVYANYHYAINRTLFLYG